MGKFLKTGKVVVILAGRYAGRKAVIVKTFDDGNSARKFGHCVVAGIDRYPLKVTRSMSKARAAKRNGLKPFIKYINFNHLMPTRYQVDIGDKLKQILTDDIMSDVAKRHDARKEVRGVLKDRYVGQRTYKPKGSASKAQRAIAGAEYFFKKLRF